jgi:hypothetical protein
MIPGLSSLAESALANMLTHEATDLTLEKLGSLPLLVFGPGDHELSALGISVAGHRDITIVVTDATRRIGNVAIEVAGPGSLILFDNRTAGGHLHASLRILGADCAMLFHGLADGYIALHDVFLRSPGQVLVWGRGATAVGLNIEHEGAGRTLLIGDDALISSGVWIRNHDMHAVHDLLTGERISRPAVDTVIERHVWLGQNALLLGCQRVGTGAIIGAAALVKGVVPPCTAMAGIPARIIRTHVSWGRDTTGMTDTERTSLGVG